jgi:hypothetical protein
MIKGQKEIKKTEYLEIAGKKISLRNSKLLYEENFSSAEINPKDWLKVGNALWTVKDGILEGKWEDGHKLKHGQIFSQKKFYGDILMEFDAQTVPPSDHDIIWWWRVKLNDEKNHWRYGYLGALGGWMTNKAGIEKIEGKKTYMAMSSLFRMEAGKKYKIQCGIVDKTVFFFANGQLIMEFIDPEPFAQTTPGRIGFGVYQSHIKISNLKVYIPKWERVKLFSRTNRICKK